MSAPEYDPRYLAGILFFNRRDYFEAHEVWEAIWREATPEEAPFFQGLIQAAVAIYHWERGNHRGARRLFHSARRYMGEVADPHRGLNVAEFWHQMARHLPEVAGEAGESGPGTEGPPPTITLDPPPEGWPDPHRV